MNRLIVFMLLVIVAFFLWIRYQLSIPGSGPVDFTTYSEIQGYDLG